MFWDRLTSPALAAVDRRVPVLLPLAATEQHGPHLPLATDRLIAELFTAQAEGALRESVLVLPAMQIGCSAHHLAFPGTLSVRHGTFVRQVEDVITSVAAAGFRSLVLFNAHGGNVGAATVVLEETGAAHPELTIVLTSWWQLAGPELREISTTGPGGAGHACELETSLMLTGHPDLVDLAAIPGRSGATPYAWAESDMLRAGRARVFLQQQRVSANGVHGDPSAGSAEKGAAILAAVGQELRELLVSLLDDRERAAFAARQDAEDAR